MIFIVLQVKGAIDAHKVTSGKDQHKNAFFSTVEEFLICKMCEMLGESIPPTLFLCYYKITLGDTSKIAIGSIIMSCLATGYTSASFTSDSNTSIDKAKPTRDFTECLEIMEGRWSQ